MELFGPLLACAALVALVAGPIVALVALKRAERLEHEVRKLRHELRALEGNLARRTPPERTPGAPVEPAAHPPVSVAPATSAPAAHVGSPPPVPAAPPDAAPIGPSAPHEPVRREPSPERAPRRPGAAAERASARARLDLERWLGVRGAAVVGGVLLALAAIFLFKEALARDWIPPVVRVAFGLAGGAAAIVLASRLRARGFDWVTNALEGGGVVALYASLWAADERYGLVPLAVSFPAMAAVTVLACWLALRHGSLFGALLGLAGGFATPVLLADGPATTLPLFGYLLLLDLGLLFVARKRGWTALALAALGGTFLFECMSFFWGAERPAVALALSAVFALLFALSGTRTGAERGNWLTTQALGVLLPFVFALHYAGEVELGVHVWPTALFLGLLVVSAAVVARFQNVPWLATAAALGAAGVVALWTFELLPHRAEEHAWELVLVALGLALLSHALAEWERAKRPASDPWRVSAAAASGAWAALVVWALASWRLEGFATAFVALGALAALLLRHAHLLGQPRIAWSAGLVLGVGLGLLHRAYGGEHVPPALDARLFWLLPLGLGALLLAWLPHRSPLLERAGPQATGALLAAFGALVWLGPGSNLPYAVAHVWLITSGAGALGVMLLLVAARLRSSAWTLVTVAVSLLVAGNGLEPESTDMRPAPLSQIAAIVLAPAAVVLLVPWVGRGLHARRFAWSFLAALPPLSVALIEIPWYRRHGVQSVLPPYLFALVPAALAAVLLRLRGAPAHAVGWIAASACFVGAFAVSDTLDHAEPAIGFALFAAALAVIGRRLDLGGAVWSASATATLATLAVLFRAVEPGAHPRSERLVFTWIDYAHLVPAACVAVVLAFTPRPRVARGFWAWRRPVLLTSLLGIVFLWLNFVIENGFSRQPRLTLFSDELAGAARHARDLVTSLVWGVYALVLLVLGTARRVSPLRWASLAVLVLAIGKVFLHDLAHLDGLYRVGALFGLALSLLGVSLFYQRFVFRRVDAAAAA